MVNKPLIIKMVNKKALGLRKLIPEINVSGLETDIIRNDDTGEAFDDCFVQDIWKSVCNSSRAEQEVRKLYPENILVEDAILTRKCLELNYGLRNIFRYRRIVANEGSCMREFENQVSLFKDQVVVDLGAGVAPFVYLMSCLAGAKGYVGIDKNRSLYLEQGISSGSGDIEYFLKICPEYSSHVKSIPGIAVKEDILRFLKRLPDSSVSLFSCGLVYAINSREYISKVNEELVRVLNPGGIFLNSDTPFHPGSLENVLDIGKNYRQAYKKIKD